MIKDQKEWIASLREVAILPNSPVQQKDGKWEVADRKETWKAIALKIFDDHLDRLLTVTIEVLRERDPQFDLEPSERWAVAIHKKVMKYSRDLRKGLAETLALLGSSPRALTSCSPGKAESTAVLAVRAIFKDADWLLWASLNDCMPTLAEAAPTEYLDAIEKALQESPSPFVDVYAQESGGFAGRNYLTGLLWGLEALAWHPDYLTRAVANLGELTALDPGGNWANRPANSLTNIFLPWYPQTCADISRRMAAVTALLREQPVVGWRLLLTLLPESMRSTSGTYKPVWRDFILSGWSENVTKKDYGEQVEAYAELAIDIAEQDIYRMTELVNRLPDLPPKSFSRLLEILASEKIQGLPEAQRQPIWEALVELTITHRKFANAEWAMPAETIEKLTSVASKMVPKAVDLVARRLFSSREWDLYEDKESSQEQQEKLSQQRQTAVRGILSVGKLTKVLDFARQVESPSKVGIALGQVAAEGEDPEILPGYLDSENKCQKDFAIGFVIGRFMSKGWAWVDSIIESWTQEQKANLLTLLPFEKETWARVQKVLGVDDAVYWKRVNVHYTAAKAELLEAVVKLLDHGRPYAALECLVRLVYQKAAFPPLLAIRALLDGLKTEEPRSTVDSYAIQKLIKWLQEHPPADENALLQVEWSYLPFLDTHSETEPKTLACRLATSPEYFCKMVQAVFRSDKVEAKEYTPTEDEKNIARNAYRLLDEWKLVPGTDGKGSFDVAAFTHWLEEVKRLCKLSGHLSIAMQMVGQVLPYTPADSDGLWIHHCVAEALNAKDAEEMRSGFTTKLFNMRGAHGFTAGKAELELATMFREKADALDARGFQRIAAAIRELARSYERDAERDAKRGIK